MNVETTHCGLLAEALNGALLTGVICAICRNTLQSSIAARAAATAVSAASEAAEQVRIDLARKPALTAPQVQVDMVNNPSHDTPAKGAPKKGRLSR